MICYLKNRSAFSVPALGGQDPLVGPLDFSKAFCRLCAALVLVGMVTPSQAPIGRPHLLCTGTQRQPQALKIFRRFRLSIRHRRSLRAPSCLSSEDEALLEVVEVLLGRRHTHRARLARGVAVAVPSGPGVEAHHTGEGRRLRLSRRRQDPEHLSSDGHSFKLFMRLLDRN